MFPHRRSLSGWRRVMRCFMSSARVGSKRSFIVATLRLWVDDLLYCFARAASIAAMSIFPIVLIAIIARLAAARSGSVVAASSARGVICHEKPQRSLHQPHALSWPPLLTMAFHSRSVSARSSVRITKLTVSLGTNFGPPLRPMKLRPQTVNSTMSSWPSGPDGVSMGEPLIFPPWLSGKVGDHLLGHIALSSQVFTTHRKFG